jgi:hypothetical protein
VPSGNNSEPRVGRSMVFSWLVDEIVLTPDGDQVQVWLKGNLAAMLNAAQNAKRPSDSDDLARAVKMVAGAGFEPATFGL